MINVYEELGETSRRQILAELRFGSKTVTELVDATELKQPNVSNHLSRMRLKGIVRSHKVGRQVYYTLANAEVEAVVQAVLNVKASPAEDLDFEKLSKSYSKSALEGDETACAEVFDVAFRAHASMLDIYQLLITPAMTAIGEWYKEGIIDESQEHMASAITERMLAKAMHITGPARLNGRCCLLGCAANSYHVIGLRMISDYLRLNGWRTLFLGANVPLHSFVSTVKTHRPDLVLLSCMASEGMPDTIGLIHALTRLRTQDQDFTLGVGGLAANHNVEQIIGAGSDFVARDLRDFLSNYLPTVDETKRSSNKIEKALQP